MSDAPSPARRTATIRARRATQVKPENIILCPGELSAEGVPGPSVAKLADFGAAQVRPPGSDGPLLRERPAGSPHYAPPEVVNAHSRRQSMSPEAPSSDPDPGPAAMAAGESRPGPAGTSCRSEGGGYTSAEPRRGVQYDAFAADVWSFGLCVFVAVTGRWPFRRADPKEDEAFTAFVAATHRVPGSVGTSSPAWEWPSSFSGALRDLLRSCLRVDPGERPNMEDVAGHEWFASPQAKKHGVPGNSAKLNSSVSLHDPKPAAIVCSAGQGVEGGTDPPEMQVSSMSPRADTSVGQQGLLTEKNHPCGAEGSPISSSCVML